MKDEGKTGERRAESGKERKRMMGEMETGKTRAEG
jgi:hypothetical protein